MCRVRYGPQNYFGKWEALGVDCRYFVLRMSIEADLEAHSHLSRSVCPSVGLLVSRSDGWSVCHYLQNGGSFISMLISEHSLSYLI